MRRLSDSWPAIKQGVSLKHVVMVGGLIATIIGWYVQVEGKIIDTVQAAVRTHELKRIGDAHVDVSQRCASHESLAEIVHAVDIIQRDIRLMQTELVLIRHRVEKRR